MTEQAGSYCTEEEKNVGGGTTEGLWNGVSNVLGPSEGNSCSNNLLLTLVEYCWSPILRVFNLKGTRQLFLPAPEQLI